MYNLRMKNLIFTVKDTDGMKISDYLKRRLGFSSALITKIKFGGVSLNGAVVTMRASVKEGDIISVTFPDEKSENVEPIAMPLDILYEDEHIIAVNKPSDMPTHPSRGNHMPTLANAVAAYLGAPFVFRAINRLDRGTSGIVIIAKNPYAAAKLGRAMKERQIHKKYLALVSGIPEPREGLIDCPIAREREGELKRVVREDGKSALTEYRVIEETNDGNAICEITLHTGRTHQIRVHMSYIGHPLVGDFMYGDGDAIGYSLTCAEISLPHPEKDEILILKLNMKKA